MKTLTGVIDPIEHHVGPITVKRMMPQQKMTAVGSFVFLDYYNTDVTMPKPDGRFAHPHRGIATLTYLLNGEITHLDSAQHTGTVTGGGAQWMNSGNGIVHDEWVKTVDNKVRGLQIWINLQPEQKAKSPSYKAVQDIELPRHSIGHHGSYLKVVIGSFNELKSAIPTDSEQTLYHIHLKAGDSLRLEKPKSHELSAFLIEGQVSINTEALYAEQLGHLNTNIENFDITADKSSGLMIFGGEPYQGAIVSDGPFVMNSAQEITQAYADYHKGKYGEMDYSIVSDL